MQNHGTLANRIGPLTIATPTAESIAPRTPIEVAVNRDAQIIAIKWRTTWHAGTCRCGECAYVHESFEPIK
jgi:hypothetical protein